MALSAGAVLAERYRIVRLLGQGGMGAVYLAEDARLGRLWAVKENFDTSAPSRRRFEDEAKILASLKKHPNLALVVDYFFAQTTGGQYLVMEYIEGEDVEHLIQAQGKVPLADVIGWTGGLLDAIEYLHAQPSPIIHRDIKPANIKISDGRAILVDFGIAKMFVAGQMTSTRLQAVTPGFAPPEQYTGGTDIRSDIYALGATLYYTLTGLKPPDSTELAVGSVALAPPSEITPTISPRLDAAILKAMETKKDDRFQNIAEMRAAIFGTGAMPARQRGAPRALIVAGAGALALVVIAGVFFGLNPPLANVTPMVDATTRQLENDPTLAAQTRLAVAGAATQTANAPTITPSPSATATPTSTPTATATFSPTPTPTLTPTPTATPRFFSIRLLSPAVGELFKEELVAPFLEWSSAKDQPLASNEFYRIQVYHQPGELQCNLYTKDTFFSLPASGREPCNPNTWRFNTGDYIWRISLVARTNNQLSGDREIVNSEGRLFKWNK